MRSLSTLGSLFCFGFLMACGGGGEGGSSNDGPAVDCRNDGLGCTAPFQCHQNDDGDYECLESENDGGTPAQGGTAGSGGQGGAAGSSDNEAGAAGQGGDAGNEVGSAGSGGMANACEGRT